MTSELTNQLAVAGLLHDIGKLMLRAADGDHPNFGGMVASFDEDLQDDFGYKHAMLSAVFVDQYLPEPWRIPVQNMAGHHHRPRTHEERIVALADILAAAARDDGTEDEDPGQQHPRQLLSIFSGLEADEYKLSETQRRYLPLRPLALERETLFPKETVAEGEVGQAYARIWEGFAQELEQLKEAHNQAPDLQSYLESLLFLSQKFLWCVPSANYQGLPDIGLHDHGRITAALAAVLNRDRLSADTLTGWLNDPETIEDSVALLVGGDISGVQDFIYTITARGATPTLRGRSFYLQILTDALARFLLRRLKLPVTNLIYAGGGSFFLLARPCDADRLPEIQQEISRIFLQQHGGALYAALADVPVAGKEFFGKAMSCKWGELHEALRRKKLQPFAEMGDELPALFDPSGHGGNEEKLCQVCGQEHADTKQEQEEPDVEPVRKCPSCNAFEKLGDDLRNARYLVLDEIAPRPALDLSQPAGKWPDTLAHLGMKIDTSDRAPETVPGTRRLLLALDDRGQSSLHPRARTAIGRRFLVNVAPILTEDELPELRRTMTPIEREELPQVGKVKTFSALASQSNGIKRLGILRMDVDNLGLLFQTGFGERATLSHIAALSFAISLYFEGWVSRVVEEVNCQHAPNSDRIYTIYSGGDDLFFVGSWDAMLELAIRIRADLTAYAAAHPGIHASAGIALVGGKYPLSQAAQDADVAEKAAKDLIWWDEEGKEKRKDAISFLDTPLSWSTFGLETDCAGKLDSAHGLMHWLVALCTDASRDTAAPRAFLRTLINLHSQYAGAQEQWQKDHADSDWSGPPQVLLGPWTWRTAYALQRAKVDGSEEIRDKLRSSDYRMMEWLGVAARWADLYIRRRE